MEQGKILAALQVLTDDRLKLTGLEVYSDGSGKVASKLKTGQTLLRGLQYPTGNVGITEQTGSVLPDTHYVGNNASVRLPFSSGDISTFYFFTLVGRPVPPPIRNVNAEDIEEAPGYIVLAHELVHAYRILRGINIPRDPAHSKQVQFGDLQGNQFTVFESLEELTMIGMEGTDPITENNIRIEHWLGVRMAPVSLYGNLVLQGVKPVSAPPSWWPYYPIP
jgi:hypothetical protein